jgi:peptidoglycan hydrolase CwlO-like protein
MTEEEMLIFKQETELKIEELEKELNEKNDVIEKLKEHNQKLFYSASALQEKQEKQEEQAKQEQAKQQEEKFDLNDFINKKRGRK